MFSTSRKLHAFDCVRPASKVPVTHACEICGLECRYSPLCKCPSLAVLQILLNLGLFLTIIAGHLVQIIFFGNLRALEVEVRIEVSVDRFVLCTDYITHPSTYSNFVYTPWI